MPSALILTHSRVASLLFSPENLTSMISKKNFTFSLDEQHESFHFDMEGKKTRFRNAIAFSGNKNLSDSFLSQSFLTCFGGYSEELCSLIRLFRNVPGPMQGFPQLNSVCFQCRTAWGLEDYCHSVLDFRFVPLLSGISKNLSISFATNDQIPKFFLIYISCSWIVEQFVWFLKCLLFLLLLKS